MDEQKNDVVITREVSAPVGDVWRMWTEAEQFQRWYGPDGATIPTAQMDVTIGGKRLICMEMNTPNGPMQMWFTGEYLDISPTTKLVYTESMSDKDGNVLSPAAMGMPDGPDTTTVTIELTDLGGSTRMVVTHAGVPAGSPGEQGWVMAIDKLVGLLV